MSDVSRRDAIKAIAAVGASATVGCRAGDSSPRSAPTDQPTPSTPRTAEATMPNEAPNPAASAAAILEAEPLGFLWRTEDPFLFCAHHDDHYPTGNQDYGPTVSLAGRNLGNDFEVRDGFRMYHGRVVPGFPKHPHRGFETVTVVRRGLLDHSDSMGAAARYGDGDVQWLTAGSGIQHSEMFPLLRSDAENPLELFQIWVNLPREDKMVAPYFTMFWNEQIARRVHRDEEGRETEVAVIAGHYDDAAGLSPPPNSWASRAEADVAIWTIKLAPGARFVLPAANPGTKRRLYLHQGEGMRAGERALPPRHQFLVQADVPIALENGDAASEILMLQGKPIGEPVAHYGPFVMNTRAELQQAFADYQRTQFGGWPWRADDPVHGGELRRFARHADGREEAPTEA